MPYAYRNGYVVNTATGERKNTRPLSRSRAMRYMRALYANEPATKMKEHTGVIVGLFLSGQVAQQLYQLVQAAGVPGAEPPTDYHITLAYLGDAAELGERRGALQELVNAYAEEAGPVLGTISGLGRFNNDEGDGTQAVYASFDSPELAQFRQMLLDDLAAIGMEVANNHGFTPHITLAYVPAEAPTPAIAIPPIEVVFPDLTLAWGGERYQAQLMPAVEPKLKEGSLYIAGEFRLGGDGTAYTAAWEATGPDWTNVVEKEAPMSGSEIIKAVAAFGGNSLAAAMFRMQEKAANYSARAGQTIAGRLRRGNDGKFTSDGAAPDTGNRIVEAARQRQEARDSQPKPTKGSGRRSRSAQRRASGRKPSTRTATPAKSEEQRRQEAEARRQEAAQRRTAAQEARRAENLAKVQQALAEKMSAAEFDALLAFNDGAEYDEEQLGELLRTGLVERDPQGQLRMTAAGRNFAAAAERGDTRDAQDALSRGQERVLAQANDEIAERQRDEERAAREAEAEARRQQREQEREERRGGGGGGGGSKPPEFSPELAAAASKLSTGQRLTRAERRSLITSGLARRSDGRLVLTAAGLRAARQATTKEARPGGFVAVYKDAQGAPRWLSATTTAFRDREREIISLAAQQKDVARSDETGEYGPLRFWHVGSPDAATLSAGPGLDIGDCDWRCVVGKSLIESGTFRRPEYAQLIQPGDQMSPGFFHPLGQPGPDGVYNDIHIFERSIVPAGRASNPFTRITTKEVDMSPIPQEKEKAWQERGGDSALLEQLLAQQAQTEKAAEARGVAFKETDVLAALAAIGVTPAALATALKAHGPAEQAAFEAAPAEEKAEPPMATPAEEPAEEAYVPAFGDLTLEEAGAFIDARLAAAVGPLLSTKLEGSIGELKSLLGSQAQATATKEAALAEQGAQIAALQTQLKEAQDALAELRGDQPSGAKGQGYRATQDPATGLDAQVVAALKAAQSNAPAENPSAFFGGLAAGAGVGQG